MDKSWWMPCGFLLYTAYVSMVTTRPHHPFRDRRNAEDSSLQSTAEENLGSGAANYQGDILWPGHRTRNAVRDYDRTWVNRSVPYVMEGLTAVERGKVHLAMEEIMNKSCVRFVPRSQETDYVKIVRTGGCFSEVGHAGGQQLLYLAANCYQHGTIVHELMHSLGFWHEHSRPDRDQYIDIMWDNINEAHRSNFDKYPRDMIDVLNTTYDYGSIMHYRNNSFAINSSLITINHTQPLPPNVEMGQRVRLSHTDVVKLQRLYRCNITHCMDPGIPQHCIRIGNSTKVAGSVFYSCLAGYLLYGSRGRTCLDQGSWTGHLPSCIPDPSGELHLCDFDNHVGADPLCGWTTNASASLPWTLRNGPTPSKATGPEKDHTMGSEDGWYAYLEASDRHLGESARLLSPYFSFREPGALCMMFYYSMYGEDMGALSLVYQEEAGQGGVPLFNMSGNQGKGWKLAAVTLPSAPRNRSFRMVIEAVVGSGYHSDIAVDDLLIGPCSSLHQLDAGRAADSFHCTFDTGWCALEQDRRDDVFDWRKLSGGTSTINTGPDCDPFNCPSGSYIYIESSRRRERDNARLKTPLLHGEGSRCVQFYWHMHGSGMGSLAVKLRHLNGSETALWTRSGAHGNQWNFGHVDLHVATRLYQLVFEGTVGPNRTSDAALDSIDVFNKACADVVHNDCTFQLHLCSWQDVGTRPWQRNQGGTATSGTGPSMDHNNNTMGFYLYVESSRTFANETAELRSGAISGNPAGYCLQFWYHMWGSNTGTLSVLTVPSHDPDTPSQGQGQDQGTTTVQWQRSGDAGNLWHRRRQFISVPQMQEFRLVFEARLAGGGEGDIAMDDVVVHTGQCESPVQVSLH
ncbi:MAM and LDL-receptor class A domain-containing protein 1-like [Babylonia areolata]|uniref:MAM and LDL-receptor class A domain-containing protein 1-like n=1 Tax=Babylonia areolata TaxID=304850 RepID=UPI003FD13847